MDQCFSAKEYPKIFLINSELITTQPPVFSSDMLNHPRLQFLDFRKATSGKQEQWEEWEESVSPGNRLQLPLLWAVLAGPHTLSPFPAFPPSQLHSSTLTGCAHHCSFSHLSIASPILVWFAASLGIPTAQGSQSLSLKAFPACPSSEAQWDKGIAHR